VIGRCWPGSFGAVPRSAPATDRIRWHSLPVLALPLPLVGAGTPAGSRSEQVCRQDENALTCGKTGQGIVGCSRELSTWR
jgi:hypothetical protein